eukprot:m.154179 g.154179  ORF g.154179 m.154179 type:complete len:196 (-) comp15077_c0_seq4:2103-2690(-)
MGDVIAQGWLTKSPPLAKVDDKSRKQWRRRYFRLNAKSRVMYYYKDDSLQEQKGEIDLASCQRVLSYLKHPKYSWVFSCVCPHREYFLATEDETELKRWTSAIHKLWKDGKPPGPKNAPPGAPPPPPPLPDDSDDDDDDEVPQPHKIQVEEDDDDDNDSSILALIDRTVSESRRGSSNRKNSIRIPPPPKGPPPK